MSQGKRYKFQGSTFSVQVGFGSPKTLTDISNTDQAVATSAGHALVVGDVGKVTGVVGITELNDNLYPVDSPTNNDFELAGVDATEYGDFAIQSPNLARFTPVVFGAFCELKNVNQQDGSADEIDVTTICSTSKEYEIGLSDAGTLQLDYNYAGAEATQAAIRAAKLSGETIAFKVVLPKNGGTLIMMGSVQQQSITGGNNGVWEGSATVKLTGEIFVL